MRVPLLSCVVFALTLSACAPSAPPAAHKPALAVAPKPKTAPRPLPAPTTPQAPAGAFPGEALSYLLMCGNPDFLAQPVAKQAQALQTEPRLHCGASAKNNTVSCTPAEPVSAFGLRIVHIEFAHENGGHDLRAQLQGDLPTLLEGIATIYPTPVRSALGGRLVSLSNDDSLALRARESGEAGQVDLQCRVAAPNELLFVTLYEAAGSDGAMQSTISTPEPTPGASAMSESSVSRPKLAAGTSAIAGHIEFPGESVPALKVCAVADDGAAACVHTTRGQSRYVIENLPADDYQVWAWLPTPEGDMRVMRATREVQCIRAPCLPQPRTLALPAATRVDGMTLNDAAASYEDQPPEPAG